MSTNDEKTLRKGLSGDEARLLAELTSKGKRIIGLNDIQGVMNCSYDNAKRTASDLAKKKWLERLRGGRYLIVPLQAGAKGEYTEHEFIIASELVNPYYIGYWSALNFHGLTEQVPLTVFTATTKRKETIILHNVTYKFITLTERKFFGYREYAVGDRRVKISSVEKTLVDSLDHLEYSGGLEEVSKAFKNAEDRLSIERLVNSAIRINNGAILKRLLYLLSVLDINISSQLRQKLRDNFTTGYPLLDSTKPERGPYDKKWMLRRNVTQEKILEWSET